MNYEFYADVFFLTNFYLDFLAVYLVSEILQQKKTAVAVFVLLRGRKPDWHFAVP